MRAVDFDRQAVERRDFPIARRGYDPASVEAHLRALADEFEQLQRSVVSGGSDVSVASSAGVHVQNILEAAEAAAADIERQAVEAARQVREAATRDAERTRDAAVEKAKEHVAAVGQVAAALLERVGSMDNEVGSLVESLRQGAGRLAADLAAVEAGMGELYDAAAGNLPDEPQQQQQPAPFEEELYQAMSPAPAQVAPSQMGLDVPEAPAAAGDSTDVDGARLNALNMALNGEPRDQTDRYLAENFQIPDRAKLIDEVYAAIDG